MHPPLNIALVNVARCWLCRCLTFSLSLGCLQRVVMPMFLFGMPRKSYYRKIIIVLDVLTLLVCDTDTALLV